MPRLPLLLVILLVGCDEAPAVAPDAGARDAYVPPRDAGPPTIDAGSTRLVGDVAHPLDEVLRLNHLQAEATHNSYHLRPTPEPLADWDYEHAPLDVQLEEQGVRGVELDLQFDAELGRWRVFHLALIDARTSCETLLECLATIRRWSDAHPGHHPIFVQLELKSMGGLSVPALLAALEAEIAAVFPPELLITPDLVRGARATLIEAVREDGWPTLGAVRGRVMMLLDCSRDWCVEYANQGAGLEGRLMFPSSESGDAWLAFRVMNTPGADVRAAVEEGLIVRTRAVSMPSALEQDGPALEAELAAALATGAHTVTTDVPVPRDDVPVFVEMPGGTPSRCNPVTAPAECTSLAIEDPARLVP